MAALAEVARRTPIPIATGERLTTKFDFARLIEHRAAAIFNFDVGQVGGIVVVRVARGLPAAAAGARARLQPARGRRSAARATGTAARHDPLLLTTVSRW
jgi:L-alanine-DL-glutamate epimerase-like enolase superfamily enzyme